MIIVSYGVRRFVKVIGIDQNGLPTEEIYRGGLGKLHRLISGISA